MNNCLLNFKVKRRLRIFLIAGFLLSFTLPGYSQSDSVSTPVPVQPKKSVKWYDTFSIRGYMQIRYNRFLETNENLGCEQCDKSWGKGGGFFLRRMRIIFYGQLTERVYFYVQPDFASSPSSDKLHFAQIRDAYIDAGIDRKSEFRFRLGQSKVPYGFENLQSSQNRLPLDRNDALNSAVSNERDMGVFFYWAPEAKRKLFSSLVRDGLKGSGDYGIVGFGFYNGQTANNLELNDNKHFVGRITYPFAFKSQIMEASIQGFTGQYVLPTISGNVKHKDDLNYKDNRVAATFVLYPKPFGIQAEYTIGEGPEFNKVTDSIEVQDLKGGYVTFNYLTRYKDHIFIPFVRYQYYDGGKKFERDARSYEVNDLEIGVEWQPGVNFEIVAMYTISERRYEDFSNQNNFQEGQLLRLQAQVNF